jgi:NADPH-dependent curcumin reductase CurA
MTGLTAFGLMDICKPKAGKLSWFWCWSRRDGYCGQIAKLQGCRGGIAGTDEKQKR